MKNKEDKLRNPKNHKNKSRNYKLKALLYPLALLKIISRSIKEKLSFSIELTLFFRYFKILLGAILAAGLAIILVFGIIVIKDKVRLDYFGVLEIVEGKTTHFQVEGYAREHSIPIQIYDQNQKSILATQPDLKESYSKHQVELWRTAQNFYIVLSKDTVFLNDKVRVVIYSDIGEQITEIVMISKISLIVFSIVLFLSVLSMIFSGRGIFQPVRAMTQTVKGISEKRLNLRLNVSGEKNELKELALTFNEMMNRIEEHDARQKQFVSDASHELRTPIAVIQGYAVMLDRWGKNDKEVLQESIDAIKNEVGNMNELIDKLLFLARHDTPAFMLQKEEFSLTEMLGEIIKETQIIDNTHKINSEVNQEVSLFADKNRIKQAIRILIDNAIKYTPADGQITVGLAVTDDNYINIKVKDTGIGMNQEELEQIFNRFYRSDRSRTKEKGGHGLGLAIARLIIQAHNGKIKVRSKVGWGTEFIIFLKA